MSFQYKLFKSNLRVAIIPMISFVLMIFILLGLFHHAFYSSLSTSDLTDADITKAIEIIEQTDLTSIDQNTLDFSSYQVELSHIGFSVAILKIMNYDIAILTKKCPIFINILRQILQN